MPRYRYDHDVPCECFALHRGQDDPIMPGEIIASDFPMHNPMFTIVDDKGKVVGPAIQGPIEAFGFTWDAKAGRRVEILPEVTTEPTEVSPGLPSFTPSPSEVSPAPPEVKP